MKRILLSLTLGLFLFTVNAQEDKDALAKKILTELSEKTKTHKSMSIDFKLTIKSKEINESQAGKAQTKGSKFHYTTSDREVFCDGETVWSYIEEDNECYIDDAEDLSDFNPSEINLKDEQKRNLISNHLFRVQKLSGTSIDYWFRHHLETTLNNDIKLKNKTYIIIASLKNLGGVIKVRLNHLGKIVAVGEY